jgi:pimeloyl-ACP methyl ester carboxylesterase
MFLISVLIWVMAGIATVAAIILGLSWVWTRHFCKPKRKVSDETPADHDLPYERVRFNSGRVMLNGWFIPAKMSPAECPTIILSHGWGHNGGRMLFMARMLHEAGFGVFLYDVRGHGMSASDGPITGLKFAEDLLAAVKYLETRADTNGTPIGVVGHSLGGLGAIVAASREPMIEALVSISAFADPVQVMGQVMDHMHIPRWPFLWICVRIIERWIGTSMATVTPKDVIGQVRAPIFLIHGASDHYISPSNMEVLRARASQENTESWLVPHNGHSDLITNSDCIAHVVAFLKKSLTSEPARLSEENLIAPNVSHASDRQRSRSVAF